MKLSLTWSGARPPFPNARPASKYSGIGERPQRLDGACRAILRVLAPTSDSFLLEGKLERHLHQPRLSGPDYLAEEGAVDIGIHGRGSKKLCMIERIERFDPQLQRPRFGERERLQHREIEVQHSRSMKRPARGAARRSQGVIAKSERVEIRQPIARIAVEV